MKEKNNSFIMLIIGMITSIITIMSLSIALFIVIDKHKKKKEEKELEDYLETAIQ